MQVDKVALDALNDGAEVHLQSLEPWVQVLTWFSVHLFLYVHVKCSRSQMIITFSDYFRRFRTRPLWLIKPLS